MKSKKRSTRTRNRRKQLGGGEIALTSRTEFYGNENYMSFFGSMLSRIAYQSDFDKVGKNLIETKNFIFLLSCMLNGIVKSELMSMIGTASVDDLFNDGEIFKSYTGSKHKLEGNYTNNGENKIETTGESPNIIDQAAQFNVLTGEELTTDTAKKLLKNGMSEIYRLGNSGLKKISYISIGTSNYGEIFLFAHKEMIGKIFVVFRGTYSVKTLGAYSKPSSIWSQSVSTFLNVKESYLYGILKLLLDTIHTIMQGCLALTKKVFPDLKDDNSVSVITTGHSLGGALATIFAYLWMSVKENKLESETVNNSEKENPYIMGEFKRFNNKICCISLGSPRVFDKKTSELFCKYVEKGFIIYKRITTRGDPIPGLPYFNYTHPCSDEPMMREKISEDCNQTLKKLGYSSGVVYTRPLDCQNWKTRKYVPDMFSHTVYLDISYRGVISILMLTGGIMASAANVNFEVERFGKDTGCRIIFYNFDDIKEYECKIVFFNLEDVRNQKSDDASYEQAIADEKKVDEGDELIKPKVKPTIEDVRVNTELFSEFEKRAKVVQLTAFTSEPMKKTDGAVVEKDTIIRLGTKQEDWFIVSKMHMKPKEPLGNPVEDIEMTDIKKEDEEMTNIKKEDEEMTDIKKEDKEMTDKELILKELQVVKDQLGNILKKKNENAEQENIKQENAEQNAEQINTLNKPHELNELNEQIVDQKIASAGGNSRKKAKYLKFSKSRKSRKHKYKKRKTFKKMSR